MTRQSFLITVAGAFGVKLAKADPWSAPKTKDGIVNGGLPDRLLKVSIGGRELLMMLKGATYDGSIHIFGISDDAEFVRSFQTPNRAGRLTIVLRDPKAEVVGTGDPIPNCGAGWKSQSVTYDDPLVKCQKCDSIGSVDQMKPYSSTTTTDISERLCDSCHISARRKDAMALQVEHWRERERAKSQTTDDESY